MDCTYGYTIRKARGCHKRHLRSTTVTLNTASVWGSSGHSQAGLTGLYSKAQRSPYHPSTHRPATSQLLYRRAVSHDWRGMAGEVVQLVKCFLHKHEDLDVFCPRSPCVVQECDVRLHLRAVEVHRWMLRVCWLSSQLRLINEFQVQWCP